MNRTDNAALTNSPNQPRPAHAATTENSLSVSRRKLYNGQPEVAAQTQPLPGVFLM